MQIDKTGDDAGDIIDDEDGGAVVEIDDDFDSPFDLEAEQEHLDTRYPLPDQGDGDGGLDDADQRGRAAVADRQQRRQADDAADDIDDAADGAGDDPGDPDDLSDYGAKVQKRIKRETAKRRHAERRSAAAEAAANEKTREAAYLKEQLENVVGLTIDDKLESIESEIVSKQALLEQAFEDGDAKAQSALTADIAKLHSEQSLARLRKPSVRDQSGDGEDRPSREPGPDRRQADQPGPKLAPATIAWLNKNEYWYSDPANAQAQALALQIDAELSRRGTPIDDEHYRELERRLVHQMPEMADHIDLPASDDGDGEDRGRSTRTPRRGGTRRNVRSPVAPADGNGQQSNGEGKRRVTITAADRETLEDLGLDSKDPAVLRRFARERMLTTADFKQRGRG